MSKICWFLRNHNGNSWKGGPSLNPGTVYELHVFSVSFTFESGFLAMCAKLWNNVVKQEAGDVSKRCKRQAERQENQHGENTGRKTEATCNTTSEQVSSRDEVGSFFHSHNVNLRTK